MLVIENMASLLDVSKNGKVKYMGRFTAIECSGLTTTLLATELTSSRVVF